MTQEKFKSEVHTLQKFFTKYCTDKHKDQFVKNYPLEYKYIQYSQDINLCSECHKLLLYSFDRLANCPHEIKPRCRKCPNPCYEKAQWKALAKLMRYSGFMLALSKIKNIT
ncbi:MAG: nitrous oxide-stimulated promoter family protein [Campylobacterales bacterium]|nr:nitrous oxide-stimulated promoter family protein [Campylobacterales bacterium]